MNSELKVILIVILSLVALAAFDFHDDKLYKQNSQITGAAVADDSRLVGISLGAGWNLIGINALQGLSSTTCNSDQLYEYVYAYFPQESKYGRYMLSSDLKNLGQIRGELYEIDEKEEAERLKNTYPDSLSSTRAVWLYNYGKACTITSSLQSQASGFKVQSGWNLIAVQPGWDRRKVSEIFDTCYIRYVLFYQFSNGWELKPGDTELAAEDIGKGFWVNAESCNNLKADLSVKIAGYEPANPEKGQYVIFSVAVKNAGMAKVEGFASAGSTVCDGIVNGEGISYTNDAVIKPGDEFVHQLGILPFGVVGNKCVFTAEVFASGDENRANNKASAVFSLSNSKLAFGEKKAALLLVNYPDTPVGVPKEPISVEDARKNILGPIAEALKRSSYGKLTLTSGDVYGWHTTSSKGFKPDCLTRPMGVIPESGIDFGGYDLIIIVYNGCSRGGRADYIQPGFVLNGKALPAIINAGIYPEDYVDGQLNPEIIISEILEEQGHLMGASHSAWTSCSGSKCHISQSNELSSIMGDGGYTYTSFNKEVFGWLDGRLLDVKEGGIYSIGAVDVENPASPQVALRISRGGDKGYFYVEYRAETDKELLKGRFNYPPEGMATAFLKFLGSYRKSLLIYSDRPRGLYDSYLVDAHPNSQFENDIKPLVSVAIPYQVVDAPLKSGEKFIDPESGLVIEYVSDNDVSKVATVKISNVPSS